MSQLMPLPLTVSCFGKIQIGSPFWYPLTQVVPEKGPLNGCVCVLLVMKCGLLSVIQLRVESLVWALITPVFLATPSKALRGTKPEYSRYKTVCVLLIIALLIIAGGSVAEWC